MADNGRTTGSFSVRGGDHRRRGLGWLWWLLLALVVIALIAFLLSRNSGDQGDQSGVDVSDDATTGDSGGADPTPADTASGGAVPTAAETGNAGQDPPLTSGGQGLLPLPAGGLATFVDQPVEATSVAVESVVADEGFWVGPSATDRVFVFFAAENAGSESAVQIQAGQPVSFTGTVMPLPPDFEAAFEIDAAEGSDQLAQQGHFIEVPPDAIRQG